MYYICLISLTNGFLCNSGRIQRLHFVQNHIKETWNWAKPKFLLIHKRLQVKLHWDAQIIHLRFAVGFSVSFFFLTLKKCEFLEVKKLFFSVKKMFFLRLKKWSFLTVKNAPLTDSSISDFSLKIQRGGCFQCQKHDIFQR